MPPADHLPRLPARRDWRIGCVGAGFIVADCHLVAYRDAGFNPVAIASRDVASARACAERHGIPTVHATVADLLADESVEVLDVAVPPETQPAILREAVKHAGHIKGILAQKPLAMSVREGRELVELCERAGIVLAVNHNMRYDHSVRAAKALIDRGDLGDPVLATIDMRAIPHWKPWAEGLASLATFVMSIHHLDTFRYWLGTPERVLASTRPDPRTKFPHEDGINLYILEFASGARAAAWDDVWTGPAREGADGDIGIRWRIEGTEGLARGTIGWPGWPARVPSTLDYSTKHSGGWQSPRWPEAWFPDAFVGTMAQLLCALEEGTAPAISGRDNLETLALCEAVRAAAKEHRVATVAEFL
ncbi:MAG: Gfo/Idh/MocA family oxidoreductase [Gemmataceae bacterium]